MERVDLEELFDLQIQDLEVKGLSEPVLRQLREQRQEVISRAMAMLFGPRHIAFLPVLHRSHLPLSELMPHRKKDDGEIVIVNPTYLTDLIETPEAYYIYDVEDGTVNRGVNFKEATELIESQGRSCLNIAECVALNNYTNVVNPRGHGLLAPYSRVTTKIAYLFFGPPNWPRPDGQLWSPKIQNYSELNITNPSIGTPSCVR